MAGETPALPGSERLSLVLVRQSGWQSLEDMQAIAGHVRSIEPRIAAFVADNEADSDEIECQAAERPCLTVSFGRLLGFRPRRGTVYQGGPLYKFAQLRRLAAAGLPVPRTAVLVPGLRLDPEVWGSHVVVKPNHWVFSGRGESGLLVPTGRARHVPGRMFLAQQFIDTGRHLQSYRVLTLFGVPLYATLGMVNESRPPLGSAPINVATQGRPKQKWHVDHADVLELAARVHAAAPEVPLKGVDILREAGTGRLFVLEFNPGGNTWHFSSDIRDRNPRNPDYERERYSQFAGLRTAARVLAERTLLEAI